MIIHNMEQRTPEWFKVRNLKLTASNAATIAVAGKGSDTYVNEIIGDYYSDNKEENYTNKHMERGKELEDEAKNIYELETGNVVTQVGFIEYTSFVGCSPDGLVGEDGGCEIKCPKASVYAKLLFDDEIDSDYIRQIQMCLLITGRKWWDFVAYNPMFRKSIYIKRFTPDLEFHAKLLNGFSVGQKKIEERVTKLKKVLEVI